MRRESKLLHLRVCIDIVEYLKYTLSHYTQIRTLLSICDRQISQLCSLLFFTVALDELMRYTERFAAPSGNAARDLIQAQRTCRT